MRASLPFVALLLVMSIVVSCVTTASEPGSPPSEEATASAVGQPTAEVGPTPSPSEVSSDVSSDAPSDVSAVAPSDVPGDDSGVIAAALPPLATLPPPPALAATPTTPSGPIPPPPAPATDAAAKTPEPATTEAAATADPAPTTDPAATADPIATTEAAATDEAPPAAVPADASTTELGAPASESDLDRKTTRKLRRILRNTVTKDNVTGLQVAIRLPSGETWVGSAGKAELDPDRPVRDDTQFAIASVTKTFVAALILQLADEGKVDLDAPFGTYFDDAPRSKKVTLRQLLSHTSGIYNYWNHPRYFKITEAWWKTPLAGGLNARDHRWTYDEMMGLVKGGTFKPGADYSYSNTNYLILGKVAEAVEGRPLHEQLRQRFFEPLGMDRTVYQPAERPDADAAHGHWYTGSGFMDHTGDSEYVPFMAAVSIADAAGAIASTASDLATWADALYGGDLLSDASLREMTTILTPGFYGLGTDVAVFHGHRGYGHRGGIRGYDSSMWYFPGSGVSMALLSNRGNWLVGDKPIKQLVKAVLGAS